MATIIDLAGELGRLTMLRGRRPETTEAERKASGGFINMAQFRDGHVFGVKFSGDAAWERHPNGDELVQVVEGSTTLHVMTDSGLQSHALKPGMLAIVPQNTWHRFEAPDGVALITATPMPTDHLMIDIEDPRTLSAAELKGHVEKKRG